MLHAVQLAASLVLVSLAAHDARFRRLPNRSVLAVAALYVVAAALVPTSVAAFAAHLGTAIAALAVSAAMFRFGWIGAGDAKLAAAVFLWAGPVFSMPALLIMSVCGLVIGLAMLAWNRIAPRDSARSREVPYGIALAVAGAVAVWAPLAHTAPTP
jgi:prepilin peptidase CpaA